MRLLFVLDPLPTLKARKDSSVAMMRAARRRGHRLFAAQQDELSWRDGDVVAEHTAVEVTDDDGDWVRTGARGRTPLREFDAVLMRKDPPFDAEYVASTWLLERAVHQGARVFNDPRAIRDHSEKLALLEFAHLAPPMLVSRRGADVQQFLDQHGDVVIKPLDGMGGSGVLRLRTDDPNRHAAVELLGQSGRRTILAQRYLPQITDGDKRVLLIAGEAVPFSLARVPAKGEWRGNLAAGAVGEARPLTARERAIADEVGPTLAARGLLLVGLDVIGDHLTEINVTSPTCFREITDQSGFDVAARFVDALESALRHTG